MGLGQHVLGFSPHGKLFAFINEQGILRIWSTETNELKQEYTPNLHLSGPCKALKWILYESPSLEKKIKKSRKSSEGPENLYLALGTSNGRVALYSYSRGKVIRELQGDGHNGKVTAITQDHAGNLYTCGVDCKVIVWSLSENKEKEQWSLGGEKPHSIIYCPVSKTIVVGSRQIKVYSGNNVIRSFVGHSSDICIMETIDVVNGEEYVVTASAMERTICLWKIDQNDQNKTPNCTLLMEDIAQCITCQLDSSAKTMQIACVTRTGVIHVFVITKENINSGKPIKPKITYSIASDSVQVIEPIRAVAASFAQAKTVDNLLFGYGSKNVMVFEYVELKFDEKLKVLVRKDPTKFVSKKALNNEGSAASSNLACKTLIPIVNESTVDYKSAASGARKKLKPIEMPIEIRLQNLNVAGTNGVWKGPQSQSQVQLLVQALHSRDNQLLRSVLCTKDLKTIQLTLQRLPVQYVGTLVNELTLLMQQKRKNVNFALNWLKILLQTHFSQLLALGSEDLFNKFGPILGIIEHRANCLKEVSKLSGRLDLLVKQIQRNTDEEELGTADTLIFEDKDSPSSDAEDAIVNKSDSDSEWNEDSEDDEDDENEEVNEDMEEDSDIEYKMDED